MDDDSMWFRRPKVGEDDVDVLRQRDEFFAAHHHPSAKCVKVSREASVNQPESTGDTTVSEQPLTSPVPTIPVLQDIVERDVIYFPMPVSIPVSTPNGFPVPGPRPKNLDSKKKKSIFLQQMEKRDRSSNPLPEAKPFIGSLEAETLQSSIIDGSGLGPAGQSEVQKLHEENMQNLASLSEDEIMQLRSQILSGLGSDKIEFLRSRRKPQVRKIENGAASQGSSALIKKENLSGDPFEKVIKDSGESDHDAVIYQNLLQTGDMELDKSTKADAPPLDIPVEELPVHPEEVKNYINMDQIEKEKLSWMTLIPKPDKNATYTSRFDFEGNILLPDEDIPTQMGLHHHSNEPEAPGYSIEELFLLARSSFQSQRVTALETLAHILENHWNGKFDGCFDPPLMPTLLKSGLAPLLRWALDDNTVSSVAAAVLCIHRLLVCKYDQLCLDLTYCWNFGHILPFLAAKGMESVPNLDELTDANIIKMDVIIGFLRMDILPRFRYILWVLCPPLSVCKLILEICTRIALHSPESAKQVLEFPGLMEAVFTKFLPLSWKSHCKETDELLFCCPTFSAVKLIRVIASSGRDAALHLMKNYAVEDCLTCYLNIDPSDGKLPPIEAQKLKIESLKLWHTLLSYGLCVNTLVNLQQQLFFFQSFSINTDISKNAANYDYAAHFFKTLQAVVNIMVQPSNNSDKSFCAPSCCSISTLVEMAFECFKRWLHEFSVGPTNYNGQVLLASCFNFIASCCNRSYIESEKSIPAVTEVLRSILHQCLYHCMASNEFANLVSHVNSSSILLCQGTSGTQRDSDVLPSLGSILWKDDVVPLLREETPFPLLTAVAHFLVTAANFDISFKEKVVSLFTMISAEHYFSSFTNIAAPFHHWFASFEMCFIFDVLVLCKLMCQTRSNEQVIADKKLVYKAALTLAVCIASPLEWLLQKIFKEFIFCPYFFYDEESSGSSFDLSSREQLTEFCNFYSNFFLSKSVIGRSWSLLHRNVVTASAYSFEPSNSLLPGSLWSFFPIVKPYRDSKKWEIKEPSASLLSDISRSLRWICHTISKDQSSAIDNIPLSVRFTCLCLVFLIDSEVFRDETVNGLLLYLLQDVISKDCSIDLVGMNCESIPSFGGIYAELLVQYEAVSFGDQCFACFVAFPLQQCYPSSWKSILFSDHEQVMFFLSVPLDKLPVPICKFLEPAETETDLLEKYFRALSSGKLQHRRSPLLYLMAVHHLHHYICSNPGDEKFPKTLLKSLEHAKQKEFSHHILQYGESNPSSELGFTLKKLD